MSSTKTATIATTVGQSYADKLREKLMKKHSMKFSQQPLSIDNMIFEQNPSSIEVSTTPLNKNSDFYTSCQSGDLERACVFIEHMDIDTLNKIEPNGSTALHAASSHGHLEIVKLLLDRHCSCHIKDKYGKTAREEAATKEIRYLFDRITPYFTDNIDLPPRSNRFEVYQNLNNENKSQLATRITKARLTIYTIHKYEIEGDNNTAQLEKIFKKRCKEKRDEANECLIQLEEFKRSKNIYILVGLYLMETFVYQSPVIDDTFLIELYINFAKFNEGFSGVLYSGHRMTNEHFKIFRYAFENKTSILETRRIFSTTKERRCAKDFVINRPGEGFRAIFEFHFGVKCYTVATMEIKKPAAFKSLKYFEQEQEEMILSGTFFEIQDISGPSPTDNDIITVKFNNIPIDRNVLLDQIKELH